MMKFLKRAYVIVPDQIISTFILGMLVISMIRGAISLFTNPPSKLTFGIVLCIGVVLGLIGAAAPPATYAKNLDKDKTDL